LQRAHYIFMPKERGNIALSPYEAEAGYRCLPDEMKDRHLMKHFSVPGYKGDLTAFKVRGVSMMPKIPHGSLAICKPVNSDFPFIDGQIYVLMMKTGIVIKKTTRVKDKNNDLTRLKLESLNPKHKPFEITSEDLLGVYDQPSIYLYLGHVTAPESFY